MTIKIEKSGGKARFKANDQEFLVADDGNVGIGTDSPTEKLDVRGALLTDDIKVKSLNDDFTTERKITFNDRVSVGYNGSNLELSTSDSSKDVVVAPDNTERMRITSDGNVGIGTDNPAAKLDVDGTVKIDTLVRVEGDAGQTNVIAKRVSSNETGNIGQVSFTNNNNKALAGVRGVGAGSNDSAHLTLHTGLSGDDRASGSPERMRITSNGYLKASPSGSYEGQADSTSHVLSNTINDAVLDLRHAGTGSNADGLLTVLPSDGGRHIRCSIGSVTQFVVANNGNVTNTNNSYGALSDIKLKENITDSTPKLDDIAAIRFVNYNLKSQPDTKQFGVIAQELEEIFPALVESTPDTEEVEVTTTDEEGNEVTTTETRETGEVTKSVKYSVLTLMAVKALQEANDKITALEERLAALEAGN